MLDVNLFRDRRFSAASLSVTLTFFSLMGVLFLLTQYLQGVLGLSALETGLRFIPIAAGVILASPVAAVLTARIGTRLVTSLGLVVVAAGLVLLATLGVASSDLHVSGVLFVIAVGMGLAMTPATDAIMSARPKAQFGVGSAVNDATREIGGALGVAVLGSLFAGTYAAHVADGLAGLPPVAAQAAGQSLAGAAAVAQAVGGEAGAAILAIARQSFVDGMTVTAIVGVGFAVAGAIIAFAFLPDRVTAADEDEAAATTTVALAPTRDTTRLTPAES
jgi:Na+/melibiose symporter-like transporter